MKKAAVIGFGFMGAMHSRQILKCRGLELAAIIEKDVESVKQKIENPGGNFPVENTDKDTLLSVPVYGSLDACLKEQHIDAVHICVHTNLHYSIAKEALENGLHVLLEKPFVLDVTEGEELIKLAREKSLILMIAHVVRFMAPYKTLLSAIKSGQYGKLQFLSLSRFSGVPRWGQWIEKQKNFGSSGGALFDLVIHDIDFAAYALSATPEIENYKILPGKLSRHDYLCTIWEYPDKGVTVKIEGGNIFPEHFPFRAAYTAVFERATLSYSTDDAMNVHIILGEGIITEKTADPGDGYLDEICLFSKAITDGYLSPEYGPDTALVTLKLCHQLADSAPKS